MLYGLAQSWRCLRQILQARGSVPQGCPSFPQHYTPVTRLPGPLTNLLWMEIPVTPSLGLIRLLEQLTELTVTFHLLVPWFIAEEYNLGAAT